MFDYNHAIQGRTWMFVHLLLFSLTALRGVKIMKCFQYLTTELLLALHTATGWAPFITRRIQTVSNSFYK